MCITSWLVHNLHIAKWVMPVHYNEIKNNVTIRTRFGIPKLELDSLNFKIRSIFSKVELPKSCNAWAQLEVFISHMIEPLCCLSTDSGCLLNRQKGCCEHFLMKFFIRKTSNRKISATDLLPTARIPNRVYLEQRTVAIIAPCKFHPTATWMCLAIVRNSVPSHCEPSLFN